MKAKRVLALVLTLALCICLAAVAQAEGDTYTFNSYSSSTPTTWNSHDSSVVEFITDYTEINMWELVLNESADGYEWACEMASEEPEDVTAQYAGDPKWGVPAEATEGYAWRVTLNPEARWEDGTPINADSYIYSMQQCLNPQMNNYQASVYYSSLPIYNAENYAKAGQGSAMYLLADVETYEFADSGDAPLYISFTQPTSAFWGYSAADYYPGSEACYVNEAGEDLMEKYGGEDYVPVTDEVIADVNYMLAYGWEWGEDPSNYLYMAFYEQELEAASWEDVGFIKTGDYELTVILKNPLTPYFFKYNSYAYGLVNEALYEAGKQPSGDMIKTNYGTSASTYMSFGPYRLASFQADKEYRLTRNENWYGWTDGKHEGQFQTTDIVVAVVEEGATQEQLFLQGKLDSLGLNADTLRSYQGSDYIVYVGNPYLYEHDAKGIAKRDENGNAIPIYKKDETSPDGLAYAASKMGGAQVQLRVCYYDWFTYINGQEPCFLFGTDNLGHDILSRLASGARFSLVLSVIVSALNFLIGTIYGAIEGYYGGKADMVMERIVDVLYSVPYMVLFSLLQLRWGKEIGVVGALLLAFVLTGWIGVASTVRTQFYRFKGQEYVLAARTLGASDARIIARSILPNSLGTIITACVLMVPSVIFTESSLSYLGVLNLDSSTLTSVGTMLSNGQTALSTYPHAIFFPALFISLMMISFNLFGNGLRDALNPTLRGAEE